ncbi:30S ribosomal protein S15 [Candidatus Woesearchaeota archaeon]|nr:30S ribosomal protein S15 [Candidatus Woesearchaeota archaeon]HIH38900.1 30S ribosomal protein S15 [Candidatus Woesearchaeota archaeon]HIJ03806.1 30S ribosomal protein S15 [Candidatus Woesearchaeota archaeon]
MARMHSRKRGTSGSSKPLNKDAPTWTQYKPKEVEMIISKLIKEGHMPSVIGIILRDNYGIPNVKAILGKTITQFLKDKGQAGELPEDIHSLIRRAVTLRKHMEENHKDMSGKRGLQLTESKIRRLMKYYKRTGKIQESWKYDPKKASIYVS